ncbi:MAG TPA: ATP-binding protein [Kofleriaceae bacterium]|nr:ATP-binding protein [Kofleriaceae bacterium]
MQVGAIEVLEPEDVLGIGLGADILIVDDDPTNLVAYEAALAPLGRSLVLVRSGVEALAKLLEQDFALILLDVTMPELSGLETARMLRERPRNQSTAIIFITGEASTETTMLDAYAVGAFDFLVKPVQPELLRAKVRVHLQLQERTHALLERAKQLRAAHAELARTVQQQQAASTAAHRLEKLVEATAALAEARVPSEVGHVAVRLGSEALDATSSMLWLVQPDGSFALEGAHGIPAEMIDEWRTIPVGSSAPATRVIARQEPMWVETEADWQREAPEALARAKQVGRVWSFAALPLIVQERVIGLLTFSYATLHRFTPDERTFLGAFVHTCEQALERARLYVNEAEARRVAEAGNHRKDEFLAMLGHELRNPLAVMLSALELIKLRDGKLGRELSILDRQVHHLTHVVGDLVDASRITHGKISLHREPVALDDVVTDAIADAGPVLDGRHVTVNIPAGMTLDADRHRLNQVLANLISNAGKYTPHGGRIEITAEVAGNEANLVVRDNGRGISGALLPSIFDLFVQGARTPDRQEGGLGIGLTLVRKLVEMHGGSVEARSDGQGHGAVFTLRWPLAATSRAS